MAKVHEVFEFSISTMCDTMPLGSAARVSFDSTLRADAWMKGKLISLWRIVTDDLMFLLVENLLWKDLAGSVSPSLSEESSAAAETGLVDMDDSFAAIRMM